MMMMMMMMMIVSPHTQAYGWVVGSATSQCMQHSERLIHDLSSGALITDLQGTLKVALPP
jgi:hypothetical protein